MVTETADPTFPESAQAEGQVKTAEEAAEKPKAPEQPDTTDWKAKAEEYRILAEQRDAARVKAEKDASSVKGQLRQQAEVNDRINDIWRAVKLGLSTNEDAMAEVEKIEAESRTRTASSSFLRRHDTLLERLREAVLGEDGKAILDLEAAPELAEVRDEWNAAGKAGDAAELALVVARVERIARAAERKQLKGREMDAKAEALKAKQEAARERGELDMGGGGVPAAASDQMLVDKLGRGDYLTTAEIARAKKAMDSGLYARASR